MKRKRSFRDLISIALLIFSACHVTGQSPDQSGCETWKLSVGGLTEADRNILRHQGVILRKEWIFADKLIPNCMLRIRMAWYFDKVIQGRVDIPVIRFGWLNANLIDAVVTKVWPAIAFSEAVPSDGSLGSEAWALLRQPWMSSITYGTLLQAELRRRGLSSEAIVTLLDRPARRVQPELVRLVDTSATARSVSLLERVGALILLDILGDGRAIRKLEEISARSLLAAIDRATIQGIVAKISQGDSILWTDLELLVSDR